MLSLVHQHKQAHNSHGKVHSRGEPIYENWNSGRKKGPERDQTAIWVYRQTFGKKDVETDFRTGLSIFFFLVFLGLHLKHMKVPRLGVQLEL